MTETFLARRPAVLLDRDGVLNQRPPRAQYVRSWSEFTWLPGATEALRLLKEAGYRVIVISNQAGVARGAMREENVVEIHQRLQAEAAAHGGRVDTIYYCAHDWDAGCECRKPRPGMLFQAQRDFSLDLTRTPFIGDDERDAEAAVMPSYYELFGTVALEAMACGSPVVASWVGGLTTTIQDGVTGRLVPEGDAAALAAAITPLLGSAEGRRLGQQAMRWAAEHRWPCVAEAVCRLYSELRPAAEQHLPHAGCRG